MIRIHPLQIGIDEVGRGAWAGPIIGAAVWFPNRIRIPRNILLRDSKLLSKDQRERSAAFILQNSISYIHLIPAKVIDSIGIQRSHQILLTKCAISIIEKIQKKQFSTELAKIFIDGRRLCAIEHIHEFVVRGDQKYQVIAAASIIAKVKRDFIMKKFSQEYPNYSFEKHVGYGTKQHQDALNHYGACPLHRKSYNPIQKVLNLST